MHAWNEFKPKTSTHTYARRLETTSNKISVKERLKILALFTHHSEDSTHRPSSAKVQYEIASNYSISSALSVRSVCHAKRHKILDSSAEVMFQWPTFILSTLTAVWWVLQEMCVLEYMCMEINKFPCNKDQVFHSLLEAHQVKALHDWNTSRRTEKDGCSHFHIPLKYKRASQSCTQVFVYRVSGWTSSPKNPTKMTDERSPPRRLSGNENVS